MDAPMELELFHLDDQDAIITTMPDDRVPMRIPPQGGWAVILGVRARNLDGCGATITTSFRDICNDRILKVDVRPMNLEDNGDGRGITTLDTVSNLQLCPTATAERNLFEEPFRFTIEVMDYDGRFGLTQMQFVPTCPADTPMCECECDQRHVIGVCPPTGPEPGPPC
jgi:hypothetical protein